MVTTRTVAVSKLKIVSWLFISIGPDLQLLAEHPQHRPRDPRVGAALGRQRLGDDLVQVDDPAQRFVLGKGLQGDRNGDRAECAALVLGDQRSRSNGQAQGGLSRRQGQRSTLLRWKTRRLLSDSLRKPLARPRAG